MGEKKQLCSFVVDFDCRDATGNIRWSDSKNVVAADVDEALAALRAEYARDYCINQEHLAADSCDNTCADSRPATFRMNAASRGNRVDVVAAEV